MRQFIVGLESLCLDRAETSLVAKPHTLVGICFAKLRSELRSCRKRNSCATYPELFRLLAKRRATGCENISEDELAVPNPANEMNDTKRLPGQLILMKNPQELAKEKRCELIGKLSIFSRLEDCASEDQPPFTAEFEGTVCTSLESIARHNVQQPQVVRKKETVEPTLNSHESASTNFTRPQKGADGRYRTAADLCSNSESVVNYEGDSQLSGPQREVSECERLSVAAASSTAADDPVRQQETARFVKDPQLGPTKDTEREFDNIYIEDDYPAERGRYPRASATKGAMNDRKGESESKSVLELRIKLDKKKALIREQNLQLGNYAAKCDMLEKKVEKLKVLKRTRNRV